MYQIKMEKLEQQLEESINKNEKYEKKIQELENELIKLKTQFCKSENENRRLSQVKILIKKNYFIINILVFYRTNTY